MVAVPSWKKDGPALNSAGYRWVALGMLADIPVAIAFTEPIDDQIRLISMRKATRNEQQIYFESLPD